MRTPSFEVTSLSVLAAVVGCAPGVPAGARADLEQSADSAGVPIVWSPSASEAGDATEVWRLEAPPDLEIGAADGQPEYLLHQVVHGAVLSDGTLVLANRGTQELRFYDPSGAHLRSSGGEGDGPGEFRLLGLAGVFASDSLLAFDTRLRRASVFGPDGTFSRSYPVPEALERMALGVVGVLDDGSLVLRAGQDRGEEGGSVRTPVSVLVLAPDGGSWTALGDFPGSEVSVVGQPTAGGRFTMSVFAGRTLYHTAAGDRIVVATNDAFSLRTYDAAGEPVLLIRQAREPRPVDARLFDSIGALMLAVDRPPAQQERVETAIAQMHRHTTLPAFGALRVDRGGNVWVNVWEPPTVHRAAWQVFGPDGVLLARIDLPPGLSVLDVGRDHVLGTVRDDLGVERVRLYRLNRGEAT